MFKKLAKKLAIAATLLCFGGVMAASACHIESAHPTVRFTVEVSPDTESAQTFELDYTLYRNMYPNTVRHFMELAGEGFYDNTIIHDVQSADWFGGGYAYDASLYAENASANALADYFNNDEINKSGKYLQLFKDGKLTNSVFSASDGSAMPTLVGEFSSNSSPKIEKGQFGADTGVLKSYYYEKSTKEMVNVRFNDGKSYSRHYKYNCATSIFSMQVSSGTNYSGSDYCIFGKVNNISTLNSLIAAVNEAGSTVSVSGVVVDNWDVYTTEEATDQGISVTFRQPETSAGAIVIKSVKITKY